MNTENIPEWDATIQYHVGEKVEFCGNVCTMEAPPGEIPQIGVPPPLAVSETIKKATTGLRRRYDECASDFKSRVIGGLK